MNINRKIEKPQRPDGRILKLEDKKTRGIIVVSKNSKDEEKNKKPRPDEKKNLDSQFGITVAGGFSLKPKFRRIKNLTSGNTSVLFNGVKKRVPDGREVDLEMEELKLKVCLRKEIPYEEIILDEDQSKQLHQRRSFNDKKRMRMLKDLKVNYPRIAAILKANSKILNNWIAYVVSVIDEGVPRQGGVFQDTGESGTAQ